MVEDIKNDWIITPSIVMSVSVCLCVSVCVVCPRSYLWKTTCLIFTIFLYILPMAVARSSSGGVVIRYVLPVFLLVAPSVYDEE